MKILAIILLAIVLILILAFADTKDHRFRAGTPYRSNLLPNVLRVGLIFIIVLFVIPKI